MAGQGEEKEEKEEKEDEEGFRFAGGFYHTRHANSDTEKSNDVHIYLRPLHHTLLWDGRQQKWYLVKGPIVLDDPVDEWVPLDFPVALSAQIKDLIWKSPVKKSELDAETATDLDQLLERQHLSKVLVLAD
jgi:hypothetical protein